MHEDVQKRVMVSLLPEAQTIRCIMSQAGLKLLIRWMDYVGILVGILGKLLSDYRGNFSGNTREAIIVGMLVPLMPNMLVRGHSV